jgi:hypothetical protein
MDRPEAIRVRAMLTNALQKDASGELERMSLRSSRGGALLSVDGLPSVSEEKDARLILSSPSGPKTDGESIATIHRALELGIN